ncbi:MAG: hypothetical protein WA880_09475 [Ornithinimicrobium sp.]
MSVQQRRLLLLAEQVSMVDADLGSATAQAWLVSAIDALGHAIIDLADGKSAATIDVPVLAFDLSRHDEGEVDRASCAAGAADLRRAHVSLTCALTQPDGIPPGLASDTVRALSVLAGALQDLAAHPCTADHQRSVRAGAHRSIRAAYRLVQPVGVSGISPK